MVPAKCSFVENVLYFLVATYVWITRAIHGGTFGGEFRDLVASGFGYGV